MEKLQAIFQYLKDAGVVTDAAISKVTLFLVIAGILWAVVKAVWQFIQWAILKYNQSLLNRNLRYFTPLEVDRATRYYVPTQYELISSAEGDEAKHNYAASPKNKLIPFFLKRAFAPASDDHKFYLVLADSGMGKTTFLVNLYLRYKNRWSFFGLGQRCAIELFPLGRKDILKDIEAVADKPNTILLLDAFDNLEAVFNLY